MLHLCTNNKDTINGKKIINELDNYGWSSIEIDTALIHYYGTINNIKTAESIFKNSKQTRDVILYSTMMDAYINNEMYELALKLYLSDSMKNIKDSVSCNIALNACIYLKDELNGHNICEYVRNKQYNDIELNTTMINFYANTNNIKHAETTFNRISNKNLVTYNAMMNGYRLNGKYEEGLSMFYDLLESNKFKLDEYTYSIGLYCCADGINILDAQKIINELNKPTNKAVLENPYVQSALICVYGKCSMMDEAIKTFNTNINTLQDTKHASLFYASIMDCFGKNGLIQDVLMYYYHLKSSLLKGINIKISNNIYCIIINSCSHNGYPNEALNIWDEIISQNVRIDGNILTAIIDCLSRNNIE